MRIWYSCLAQFTSVLLRLVSCVWAQISLVYEDFLLHADTQYCVKCTFRTDFVLFCLQPCSHFFRVIHSSCNGHYGFYFQACLGTVCITCWHVVQQAHNIFMALLKKGQYSLCKLVDICCLLSPIFHPSYTAVGGFSEAVAHLLVPLQFPVTLGSYAHTFFFFFSFTFIFLTDQFQNTSKQEHICLAHL